MEKYRVTLDADNERPGTLDVVEVAFPSNRVFPRIHVKLVGVWIP